MKTANPALYMRTRPKMSPMRPKVTTRTAVTTRYPMSIHRRKPTFAGRKGSRPMPRKMAGSEMITMEVSSDAMKTPRVVLDSTVHL